MAQRVEAIAERLGDVPLQIAAQYYSSGASYLSGDYEQLGDAYLLADQVENARACADRALALTRGPGECGYEAWAVRLLGEVASHGRPDVRTAAARYGAAMSLASELEMRPLGMPVEDVTVHVTLLGGGFGRKSKPDFMIEAALLSQAMGGAPVKVTWTRDDDLDNSYYHTVSVERLEAGLDAQGKPVAWLHRTVAPTIASTFDAAAKDQAPFELGMTAINVPFVIPNVRIENPEARAHTRIGWFRSVSNIPHAFAVQSFVAELAVAVGRDPKDFLLELIGPPRRIDTRTQGDPWNYGESPERYPLDTGRQRRVVEIAAREANWGKALPKGRGQGIAVAYSFLPYVAAVVEVAVGAEGTLAIPRVDIAVDCGAQINPERVRAQMQGACVMGVSLPTREEISHKAGRVEQNDFHSYEIARMGAAPRAIRVHAVPGDFKAPLGAWASRGCHRSRRRCATRSPPRPASASAACRSAIS